MKTYKKMHMTTVTRNSTKAVYIQAAIMAGLLLFAASCGGGSSASNTSAGTETATAMVSNHLTITHDEYGLLAPNFYYSTDNAAFWSIQAAVAKDVYDENFKCVIRIDIPKAQDGTMPSILGKTFSIEDDPRYEKFPGEFFVFNGHKSVYKKVEQGTISFTAASSSVTGTFDVIMTDYDSTLAPRPQYRLAGSFNFNMDTYGPADPLPAEVYPVLGQEIYDRNCASCHSLGEYNSTAKLASDLSMRGGELPATYDSWPYHPSIPLSLEDIAALRIFLNAS